ADGGVQVGRAVLGAGAGFGCAGSRLGGRLRRRRAGSRAGGRGPAAARQQSGAEGQGGEQGEQFAFHHGSFPSLGFIDSAPDGARTYTKKPALRPRLSYHNGAQKAIGAKSFTSLLHARGNGL